MTTTPDGTGTATTTTTAQAKKAGEDLWTALFLSLVAEAFSGQPVAASPGQGGAQADQAGQATTEAAQAQDTTEPDPATEAADKELDAVLLFIRRMPTWGDDTVAMVRTWLVGQLRDHAHRNTN